jgi:hypothetical protein
MEDNMIYHYTSTEALLKILSRDHESVTKENYKNKVCLRATHAKFLNDPHEFELALTLLEKSLLKFEKENPSKNGLSRLIKEYDTSKLLLLAPPGEPYLFALSEHPDNLSMWRAYGINGTGVSIGLDKKMLFDYENENSNTLFSPCYYDLDENISRLSTFWSSIYDKMPLYINEGKIEGKTARDFQDFLKIIRHCFSIKSSAYIDEKEWRLCSLRTPKDVKYRIRSGLLIPYIEHYFRKDIIKSIVIGPCSDAQLSERSIKLALMTFGYNTENVLITISQVPYRGQ